MSRKLRKMLRDIKRAHHFLRVTISAFKLFVLYSKLNIIMFVS